ncbi:MAG: hypothetical protein HN348_17060, partial [Proteobacteria bacterium]|nr:hypothetical protein [Pseudomonadota bacterium]
MLKIISFAILFAGFGCAPPEDEEDSGNPEAPLKGRLEPRFEINGNDFYRLPWPSDTRITEEGLLMLSDFPQSDDPLIEIYLSVLVAKVSAFSIVPVIYVAFDHLPEVSSIPLPTDTLTKESPIQLVNVSTNGCGERIPIEIELETKGDDFISSNVVKAVPVPGFHLEPGTPYSLIVLTSLGEDEGLETSRPDGFEGILEGTYSNADVVEVYAPLVDCLQQEGIDSDTVAVATVFTTQDPTADLITIRDYVVDQNTTAAPVVADWAVLDSSTVEDSYISYRGTFETPIFQSGTSPYNEGGGFQFTAQGIPVVQRWETVPFIVTFPDTDEDGPLPVMIWEDGTGATLEHHVTSDITEAMLDNGFAVFSFEPQFHGDRAVPASSPQSHTFNDMNPEAGRSV